MNRILPFGCDLLYPLCRILFLLYGRTDGEQIETSMKNQRFCRPTEGFPRIRIFATRDFYVEVAAEFAGVNRRGGGERTGDLNAGAEL